MTRRRAAPTARGRRVPLVGRRRACLLASLLLVLAASLAAGRVVAPGGGGREAEEPAAVPLLSPAEEQLREAGSAVLQPVPELQHRRGEDGSSWLPTGAASAPAVGGERRRRLLQAGYVANVCDAYSGSVDAAAVVDFASKLVGDPRLQVAGARFTGACSAFGLATLAPPHALATQFSAALVLSTGDATAAVAEAGGAGAGRGLSTDLQQSGDAATGSYTYDAAVLEVDVSVAGAGSASDQLVVGFLFASAEYGAAAPNPDALSIMAKTAAGSEYADVALPGGARVPPPGAGAAAAASSSSPVQVVANTAGQYNTALSGFTQVLPTQGYTVSPGGTYTLRFAVADANNALVDSVLMLPAGSLRLLEMPVASAGGPYAVAPNSQLTLAGAKSSSANGAILQYLWRVTPLGSSAPTITANGPTVSLSAPAIGQYNVSLDVWDAAGGHDSETTSLSVDATNVRDWWSETPSFAAAPPAAPPRPTAVIAVNGTAAEDVLVKAWSDAAVAIELDGSGSGDARASKLGYAWRVTQTEPAVAPVDLLLGFSQPAAFVHSFAPGTYLITLDVSGPGGSGTSQTLLTVQGNTPPVASAGGPYTSTVGTPVVVSAEQSIDPDGDPLTFEWTLSRGGAVIGTYSGPALSMKLNKPATYDLKLTVRDDRGGASSTITQISNYDASAAPPPAPAPAPVPTVATAGYAYAPPPATTTVIAAVPAPPPAASSGGSSAMRTAAAPQSVVAASAPARPANPIGTPISQYTPPSSSPGLLPALSGFLVPSAPPPAPAPAMCLFSRDGNGTTNSTNPWDAALDNPNWNNLDLFSWTNTYWAPCENNPAAPVSGSSNASVLAKATDPLKSNAVIRSPEAFVTASGPATQVFLDATGSTAAVGRSLIAFSWTVRRRSDGSIITQVDGLRTPVWLGPGVYSLSLQVTDTAGQVASADAEFSIGDVAETLAYISSPPQFVEQPDSGALDVPLSAAGSKAGPGRSITSYSWAVMRLPDNARVSTPEGPAATASLPVGSYRAYLAVFDSGGGNATTYRDFVVGNRDASGALAVITWPPALVQAADSGGATTVALDASGSAPSRNGSAISTYVWAVVTMPNKVPVANATGRLTTVGLPPGFYQVGLLVADSDGNTATARKNFAISGTSANVNNPPIVKPGLAFTGTAGGSVKITGVTDPDGDAVSITWALMDQATGRTTQGRGASVLLAGQKAGQYLLLITANDGRGGETSGTAKLTVASKATGAGGSASAAPTPAVAAAALPSSGGSSSSGARLAAPKAPLSSSTPSSSSPSYASSSPLLASSSSGDIRKLPAVALPQGAVMELDASAFDLLPAGAKLDGYVWELRQRSTGEQAATVYGRLGHFELSSVDTYDLRLTATDTKGREYRSTGSVRVVAPTAAAAALDPWMSLSGKCGPFSAKQYAAATLSCPDLSVAGVEGQLSWAWKLMDASGAVRTKAGPKPALAGLSPGHYRVEVAVGVGGPPSNQNTAYYLVTSLKVDASSKLSLALPKGVCAGGPVSLAAPALALAPQSGVGVEPDYSWRVTWLQSQQVQGFKEVLRGQGRTFGFTAQAGDYDVELTATLAGGAALTGRANLTVPPCLKCKPGVVTVKLPKGKCAADKQQARQVLAVPPPDGTQVSWHSSAVRRPGQRKVQVVAKAAGSGLTASCSATVSFVDAEPPSVKPADASGLCVAPANGKWVCWRANSLVQLSDNCQADAPLAFMVSCGAETTSSGCRVLPDGQACIRASTAGKLLKLMVAAKDGYGNIAPTLSVPVAVQAAAAAGCQMATLASPEAAQAG